MGGRNSKKQGQTVDPTLPPNQVFNYDDEVVNRLRKELDENPEIFLLNNILMSIQFYENFEREMEDLRKNQVSEREIELNRALAEYQKHCLLPDTVMECINDRVRFRPFHGPKKFESEPLLPQRMFIVHDNIEVLYEGETSEYSTVDGPVHRAVIERANKQGYVQLRQVEFLNFKGQNTEDSDSDENPTSPDLSNAPSTVESSAPSSPTLSTPAGKRLFTKKNGPATSPSLMKEPQFVFSQTDNTLTETKRLSDTRKSSLKSKILRSQSFTIPTVRHINLSDSTDSIKRDGEGSSLPKSVPKTSTSTVTSDKDEEYGYTTIRRLTASKPLNEARAHRNISDSSFLSTYCITEIKERKILDDDDSDSDDSIMENGKRRPPVKKKKQDFYEIKKYFNSVEFAAHFGDVFGTIYAPLGFTKNSLKKAMSQGGAIHCDAFDGSHGKISYEVIPTVATSWPELALEWDLRRRAKIVDPTTNIIYQWPTQKMIKKIRSLQSNVLPFGFLAKRGVNENNSLEWSLAFPAAERYMETCMSHSQVRCYLFILALYKTFMEPPNTKLGLAPHHILTLIFWECEKNFITWPEDRLGTKMLKILKNLYEHLSRGHLPDYFVRERNLLESTPKKYLRISQSRLHDIMERPVMHVLLAMRNLRYTSGTFFPTLNFKKLYTIITINESLALINPTLSVLIDNNMDSGTPEEVNELQENKISFWTKARKAEDRERKWKLELRKQIDAEKREQQENLKKLRRGSVDSINMEIEVPQLDSYRKRVLLEFFIIHFVAVANKCCDYEAYNYAMVILNHCHCLAILLGEEPSGEVEARPWKKKISEQLEICRREIRRAKPRPVSNRDSRQFAGVKFNVLEKHQLNMSNLLNAYNSNNSNENMTQKKKPRPENIKITADVHTPKEHTPKTPTRPISIVLDNDDSLNDSTDL